jgi:dihydroneopterin aldolase
MLDLSGAGSSDALEHTVDYGSLVEEVAALVGSERWNLIERVAQRVADTVLALDRVSAVTVTVHKPDAPVRAEFDDIAVKITRERA